MEQKSFGSIRSQPHATSKISRKATKKMKTADWVEKTERKQGEGDEIEITWEHEDPCGRYPMDITRTSPEFDERSHVQSLRFFFGTGRHWDLI
jgi:hypothetical protein